MEGSKKFLGGSLLEAMLGLVDGAIVRPIPTPCSQTVGGGRGWIPSQHLWPGFPEFLNPGDTNLVAG